MSAGRIVQFHGVDVLQLCGSPEERARQHGELLKDKIKDGAVPALAAKNRHLIAQAPALARRPLLRRFVVFAYQWFILHKLRRNVNDEWRAMSRAFCAAAGISTDQFYHSLFQPDALLALSRSAVARHLLGDDPRRFAAAGVPGCTTGVAAARATRDGRLLMGRNLDYPIVGPWEPRLCCLFHVPSGAGEIPFVSIASAGVHTGSVTSCNREGLALATHAHFGLRTSMSGVPIVILGDTIIRRARRLDEAIDIARKTPRIANWSFVIASGAEDRAVIIEMTPDETRVIEMQDAVLAHSNFFRDPQLKNHEISLSGACDCDLTARICNMKDHLDTARGSIGPSTFATALSGRPATTGAVWRVVGDTTGVVTTVQSVILDPKAQILYVARRPESPVSFGDHVIIDIEHFFDDTIPRAEPVVLCEPTPAPVQQAARYYRNAYMAAQMNAEGNLRWEAAGKWLDRSAAVHPEDGAIALVAGIVAFKNGRNGPARELLQRVAAQNAGAHSIAVRDLFLARLFDIEGRRAEAVQIYQKHAHTQNASLAAAHRRGLSRAFDPSLARNIHLDLQFPDCLSYA